MITTDKEMKLLEHLKGLNKKEIPKFIKGYIEDLYTRSTTLLKELGSSHEQERPFILRELEALKDEASEALPIIQRFDITNKLKMVSKIDLGKWKAVFTNARQSERRPNKIQRTNTHNNDWHNDYGNASNL